MHQQMAGCTSIMHIRIPLMMKGGCRHQPAVPTSTQDVLLNPHGHAGVARCADCTLTIDDHMDWVLKGPRQPVPTCQVHLHQHAAKHAYACVWPRLGHTPCTWPCVRTYVRMCTKGLLTVACCTCCMPCTWRVIVYGPCPMAGRYQFVACAVTHACMHASVPCLCRCAACH